LTKTQGELGNFALDGQTSINIADPCSFFLFPDPGTGLLYEDETFFLKIILMQYVSKAYKRLYSTYFPKKASY
jgi:hypothetical protein